VAKFEEFSMNRVLYVIAGPDQGKRYHVSDSYTTMFGRSRHANTQLTDTSVSRVHCEVEIRNKRVLLTDLESASGTFVNNQRVSECELKDGDIVRLGNTQMRVDNPIADAKTLPLPLSNIPARPVLKTAERLRELTGNKMSHYDVGPVIAKGASGLIFKAYDFKNDRDVAFKVLWPEFSQNEDDMQRFVRAMKTMMPLRHANLVTLYGAGKTGPYCWIAMELVAGESLTQIIERIGTANMLDWKRVLRIGYYLAKALDYAHGQNIIHRNLTPQNVMVGKTPETTKLGDLMLAKAQEGGLAQQITKPGEILGDLRYMSPERTGDSKNVDARSDLYSLGALMYAMLTGRPPFEGNNLIETMTKIRQADPVKPKKYQLGIPDLMEGMVLKLLSKRPEDRYANANALLKEMDRVAKWNNVEI
jgi:serine/threonine protein kinase